MLLSRLDLIEFAQMNDYFSEKRSAKQSGVAACVIRTEPDLTLD